MHLTEQGNLRAQIKRAEANGKRCRIFYNTQLAPYIDFLEGWVGRNKKGAQRVLLKIRQ